MPPLSVFHFYLTRAKIVMPNVQKPKKSILFATGLSGANFFASYGTLLARRLFKDETHQHTTNNVAFSMVPFVNRYAALTRRNKDANAF